MTSGNSTDLAADYCYHSLQTGTMSIWKLSVTQ